MTAAVLRSSPNLSVPQTQNTAPVYEFNCLYTHDLRRKQKRWQDGFLRYHTFNKRVMVYDVPRNFLGDLHWTYGDELQEGDEMTLEKGAIMVQVAERVGITQTDLSGLLQRKEKTPAKPPASFAPSLKPRTPQNIATSSSVARAAYSAAQSHAKHRSLNALLGQSRRPIGKASVPTESPFDARNRVQENAEREPGREQKRRRTEEATTKTPKQAAGKTSTTSKSPKSKGASEVIHISSDTEDSIQAPTSDHLVEAELLSASSPPRHIDSPAPALFAKRSTVRQQLGLPGADSPLAHVQTREVASASARVTVNEVRQIDIPNDGKISTSNKALDDDRQRQRSASVLAVESDSQKRGKPLKLVGGAPRKMLVFQSTKARPQTFAAGAERIGNQASHEVRQNKEPLAKETPMTDVGSVETTYRKRMQERLARMGKKKRSAPPSSSPEVQNQHGDEDKTLESVSRERNHVESAHHKELIPAEEMTLPDLSMPDVSLTEINEPIAQSRDSLPMGQQSSVRLKQRPKTAESGNASKPFKPPTVRAMVTEIVPMVAPAGMNDERTGTEFGPWSKEAFDLMDWRPPEKDA